MENYHIEEKTTAKEIPNQSSNKPTNQPTSSIEKRLIYPQLVKNSPHYMKPKG